MSTTRGSVAYAESGRGKTIILMHGSVSDLRIWQPLFSSLARSYRVIAYSRRHHWPNPAPFDEYSFLRDTDDLAEIAHQLAIATAHLVAHSAAGLVALEFAKRYPEHVLSLTLFDANAPGLLKGSEAALVAAEVGKWLDPVRQALVTGDDPGALQSLLAPLAGRARLPKWFLRMANDNLSALKRQFSSKAPVPSITCEELKQLPMPVLVLQGENSPYPFQVVNQALRRCARTARLESIRGCGHLFQVDAPGQVLQRIRHFLQ